jgi:transposase
MAHPAAPPLLLRVGDHEELTRLVRASSVRAGLAQRARIVLLASEGLRNAEIADRVGVSRPTVNVWRSRYVDAGMAGLVDVDRPGRPTTVDQRKIIAETLRPPPARLGVTHWSSRLLANRLKLDHATVLKAWRSFGVTPWRAETFKFSTDPELVAKVTDIIGLYLAPPENAIVLCVDEKSQIQALDRTQKTLPMQPGHAEQRTHDYVRYGTTTLFAALEIATGKVTGLCKNRHRHQEFLAFLKHVARSYPRRRAAPGDGQLRRPQTRRDPHLASGQPQDPGPLHPNLRVMAEPGRGLVRNHRTPSHPPRHLPLRPRPHDQDPSIHRRLERPQAPVHLDQDRRRRPGQNQP